LNISARHIGGIFLLAAAYFVAAKLFVFLAQAPDYISPVWPAAGIALAGILLGGYRYAIGVFIGALAYNLCLTYVFQMRSGATPPFIMDIALSSIATLQAIIGAWLILKYVKMPTRLTKERSIFMLLLWGGPIACLIGAGIGCTILYGFGLVSPEKLGAAAMKWWVGDVIGVVSFAPMCLIFMGKRISVTRKVLVIVPQLLLCMIVVIVFNYTQEAQKSKNVARLAEISTPYVDDIRLNLEGSQEIIKSMRRYFNASDHVSREEFKAFVYNIFNERDGIQALEWIPRVTREERAEFIEQARKDGFHDFDITEKLNGKSVVSVERDEYFPVYYVEPYVGNEKALGFDPGHSNSSRQKALEQARDSGNQIATEKIVLVQEEQGRYGFLIFEPVYDTLISPNTVQERRNTLRGFALGVFRIQDLVGATLERIENDNISLYIVDTTNNPDSHDVIYGEMPQDNLLSYRVPINFSERQWTLVFSPTASFAVDGVGVSSWWVLIGGLVFSAMFGAFLLLVSAQTETEARELYDEKREEKSVKIYIIPILSGFLTMALTFALFLQFERQQYNNLSEILHQQETLIHKVIKDNVTSSVMALRRMANRWEIAKGTPKTVWDNDALNYVSDNKALTTVEWVDESYHVRWVQPLEGNENAVGLDIAFNDERKEALDGASAKNTVTLTAPLDLVQGYRGMIAYIPIYIDDQFKGFIVGIYDLKMFLENTLPAEYKGALNLKIYDEDKDIFEINDGERTSLYNLRLTEKIHLFNRTWTIEVSPNAFFMSRNQTWLPLIILLSGFIISLLMSFAIFYATTARRRSKLLKQKAASLIETESRNRAILYNTVDAILTINKDGIIQSFNPAAEKMFGYTMSEAVGKNVNILMPHHYAHEHDGYLQNFIDTQEAKIIGTTRELEAKHKDGSIFPIQLSVSEIVLESGILFSGIIRDISEQVEAEEKLKNAQHFQTLITNTIPDLIFVKDSEFRIVQANDEFLKVYPKEQRASIIGTTTVEKFDEEKAKLFLEHDKKAMEDGYSETEEQITFPDGRVRMLLTKKVRFFDEDGETFILGISRDITAYKNAEAEILKANRDMSQAKEEAMRANVMKSEFLANMSHEIRTPLNGVIGAADLLTRTDISENQEKYLQIIKGSGDTLLALINDILDISKIEAGELSINPEPVVINDLIRDSMHAIAPKATQKGLELRVDYEGNVPGSVLADPVRLGQIMVNLLGNAVKFVENGHIRVLVKSLKTTKSKVTLRIEVEDTGIGIPEDKLDSIFDKFSQADATTTKKYGGTGVGLAITQKLVEMMGGKLGVNSDVGEGTTFWFELTLPIIDEKPASEPKQKDVKKAPVYNREDGSMQLNARILLVENEMVNQMVAMDMLEGMGCSVDLAENGQKAIEMLQAATHHPYDITLMDCMMPIMDGFQATENIRSLEKEGELDTGRGAAQIIIAMTANAMAGEKDRCLEVGMNDYLSKPVKEIDLYAKLNAYLKKGDS